jgi:GNAT superfamily N-acetyltransferase
MPAPKVMIRAYDTADYDQVVALFIRINRELAPDHMREQFEQYIATVIDGELKQLSDIFSAARRNAFWVVEADSRIVGMFGIEACDAERTELRRMYLDKPYRGRGIAQRMLACAEARARELDFATIVLSTAEVQNAAIAFYRKSGYRLVRTELANMMSTRTVGGGLTRFHFEEAALDPHGVFGTSCGSALGADSSMMIVIVLVVYSLKPGAT